MVLLEPKKETIKINFSSRVNSSVSLKASPQPFGLRSANSG